MINKDYLLDSYFKTNDYKETDIETAIKDINEFIKNYGFDDIDITKRDVMSYVYKNHDFLRLRNVNEEDPLVLGLNNVESTVSYLESFDDEKREKRGMIR